VSVVLLSGGSGGAKLARGLYGLLGAELTVIANTADDIEIYGACVSPDPDLITYWLADRIDARGWGIAGDSFAAVEMLRELGADAWFGLGDRDLALCLRRRLLRESGLSATEVQAQLTTALGVSARVLPMSEQPVRTRVHTGEAWVSLQEFMVKLRASAPIAEIAFDGADQAHPTTEVLDALASARSIVIGPSNPVISIGPILALSGMRDALRAAPAPVVAVSPVVGGAVLKGPTAACLAWAGRPADASGVIGYYDGLLDGFVSDEPVEGLPALRCDTLLSSPRQREAVAQRVLDFARSLA
jgi:LPPG:FO 2-phospho-L-lactate transferase